MILCKIGFMLSQNKKENNIRFPYDRALNFKEALKFIFLHAVRLQICNFSSEGDRKIAILSISCIFSFPTNYTLIIILRKYII